MLQNINITLGQTQEVLFFDFEQVKAFNNKYYALVQDRNVGVDEEVEDLEEEHEFCFDDVYLEELSNFCLDDKGNVRIRNGIVSMSESTEYDFRYVPSRSFMIEPNAWNSHQHYVTIDLPNPVEDYDYYIKIRTAWIDLIKEIGLKYDIVFDG